MCLYMYTCRHCVFVGCVMLRVVLAGSVRALQEMVKCGSETSLRLAGVLQGTHW